VFDPNWRLKELQEETNYSRSVEEFRMLEYPRESAAWILRVPRGRSRNCRRSRLRTILGWVGLARSRPSEPERGGGSPRA
jgi:hypothetical protein